MTHRTTPLAIAALLALAASSPLARAADANAPGLRIQGNGLYAGATAVVNLPLPRPAFLSNALFDAWWRQPANSLTARGQYRLSEVQPSSGLRISGGVVGISRQAAYGGSVAGQRGVVDLATHTPRSAWAQGLSVSVPYVGIGFGGYSNDLRSVDGGWGFNADLGLMTLTPRSGVRLDRAVSSPQSLDDALRDLRLSPMLQLGVTYTF